IFPVLLFYGFDGSATAIQKGKERLKKEDLEAELTVGDAIKINYPDAFFDCVVEMECLMGNGWEESKIIVKEIHRVLKNGGLFYSQTFSDKTYIGKKQEAVAKNTYREINDGHLGRKRLLRLTPEEDISELYSDFATLEYDRYLLTCENRKYISEEWIITCTK
ncbi:class I SAM-dependent methyltransferase, partial [Candidatus Riflebacteria bacterium]